MKMESGQTLLHYRLIEKIGEGGMGVVWKALDTSLEREVAIKVLPDAFAADSERMARFEREAKLLGALNHPGIATIYGLHESAGTRFIVMELVPGEDLATRLARGAMPLDEASELAARIADALGAAHARGVIHRDLKPANIKLTGDGKIKVLDFGLAKAIGGDAGTGYDPDLSPTLTSEPTRSGVILGTAAYMSPEQARGKTIDQRSDVWAFGCLLYECLTGGKAFPGETISDTLAAILKNEPDWAALPARTPEALRRLLRRCLAKDKRRRMSSLADARLEIEEIMEEPDVTPAQTGGRNRWPAWAVLPVIAALSIVAFAIFVDARTARESESAIQYKSLTYQRGWVRSARISPDGMTIVYSAAWEGEPLRLFLQRLDSAEAQPVPLEPSHARLLSISSNGDLAILLPSETDSILLPVFRSGVLARVPLTGGTPRPVAEDVRNADWDPTGEGFALIRGTESGVQLEYPEGHVLHRTTGDAGCLRVSPTGNLVAFFDWPFANNNRGTVAVIGRKGDLRTLTPEMEGLTGLAWSADGNEIWFSGADDAGYALFAVDLSGHLRVVRRSPGDLILHDRTPDGIALVSHYRFNLGIAALQPGERRERDLSWGETAFVTDISADGSRVLFLNQDRMVYEVWLRRADGSPPTRLGPGFSFTLSPDGKWALACQLSRTSPLTLLPTGTGSARELGGKHGALFADWTPDAQNVVLAASDDEGLTNLYIQGVEGGEPRAISTQGVVTGVDRPFYVSPDGRWVAALNLEGLIKLFPIAGGEPRDVPGALAGEEPAGWTPDGGALYVSQTAILPAEIFRLDIRSGERSLLYELMPRDPAGIAGVYSFVITPDGKGYAYSYARYLDALFLVTGLE